MEREWNAYANVRPKELAPKKVRHGLKGGTRKRNVGAKHFD